MRIALFTGILALAVALAACGGSGSNGGGGGGDTPPAQSTTQPPATPGASGSMTVNAIALANANVVYTCGCSSQAGTTTTDASGNFTLSKSSTAVPPSPNPAYTMVPGRNYMVIGANSSTHTEAWTMLFLGDTPATNLYLGPNGTDATDVATTAAALYVFLNAQDGSDTSFDDWNFNAISAWAAELRTSPKTAAEAKLLSDIATYDGSTPLYPTDPVWDNDPGSANATIAGDIEAITPTSDPLVPTPCPSPACTGAPNP